MSEYAVDFSANNSKGRLRNSHRSAVIANTLSREVVRCHRCLLVQFRTISDLCRRCAGPLPPRPQPDWGPAEGASNAETLTTGPVSFSAKSNVPRQDLRFRGKITRELDLGRKLRELRKLKKWTQDQVAAKAGVPRTYVSRVEHSRLLPGPAVVHRFADALAVEIATLLPINSSANDGAISIEDPFWNSFVWYFRRLQAKQKSVVLARFRALTGNIRREDRKMSFPHLPGWQPNRKRSVHRPAPAPL